jgi:hypothetical protein
MHRNKPRARAGDDFTQLPRKRSRSVLMLRSAVAAVKRTSIWSGYGRHFRNNRGSEVML